MKKILLCMTAVLALTALHSCQQQSDGRCRIEGTVNGEQYEGKRIFLVPFSGPATAETVDSMEITDGKFHFEPDSMQMYKILLDYHYRFGLQPLLIVAEPGVVKVTIDSISHAAGTPQNDTLEHWKQVTEQHNHRIFPMRKAIAQLKGSDTIQANNLKHQADSIHLVYKNYTRELAKTMDGTVLGDFLKGFFPKTYKRKKADGTVVTVNADTNEEIPE